MQPLSNCLLFSTIALGAQPKYLVDRRPYYGVFPQPDLHPSQKCYNEFILGRESWASCCDTFPTSDNCDAYFPEDPCFPYIVTEVHKRRRGTTDRQFAWDSCCKRYQPQYSTKDHADPNSGNASRYCLERQQRKSPVLPKHEWLPLITGVVVAGILLLGFCCLASYACYLRGHRHTETIVDQGLSSDANLSPKAERYLMSDISPVSYRDSDDSSVKRVKSYTPVQQV